MSQVSILAVSAVVFALIGVSVEGARAQDATLSGDQLKPSVSAPAPTTDTQVTTRTDVNAPASAPEPTVSYEEIWKSLLPPDLNDPNSPNNVTGRYLPSIAAFDGATRSSKNPNKMMGPRFLWSYSWGYPKPIEISYGDERRSDIDGYVHTCMSEHPGGHISIRVWYDEAGYPKQIPQSQFESKQLEMAGWVAACVNKRLETTNWAHANHVGVLLCEYYSNHCWGDDKIWAKDGPKNPFFDTKPVASSPARNASGAVASSASP